MVVFTMNISSTNMNHTIFMGNRSCITSVLRCDSDGDEGQTKHLQPICNRGIEAKKRINAQFDNSRVLNDVKQIDHSRASELSTSQPKKKRKVQFSVAPSTITRCDDQSTQTNLSLPEEAHTVQDNYKRDLWWDRSVINENRKQVQQMQSSIKAVKCEVYDILQFFRMSYKPHNSKELKLHMLKLNDLYDTVRGLERHILPKLIIQQTMACHAVLQYQQQQLKAKQQGVHASSDASVSSSVQLIRRRSVQLSRASRQLAYRLAQCDEYQAKQIYAETC